MIGHIVRSVDFERVLGRPSCARSAHFAVHHLVGSPTRPGSVRLAKSVVDPELSTGQAPAVTLLVEELPVAGCWLGLVVPKRYAKRAVTRNLIKRQIRQVAIQGLQAPSGILSTGLWVVRLRAPFDRKQFTSPGSDALRQAAFGELSTILRQAVQRIEKV